MMRIPLLVSLLAIVQPAQPTQFVGTLGDTLTTDNRMISVTLEPGNGKDKALPGVNAADRVFQTFIQTFKRPSAPAGLKIALVEGTKGSFVLADVNLDGEVSASERFPYTAAKDYMSASDLALTVTLPPPASARVPIKGRIVSGEANGASQRMFYFTPVFRVEGHVDIAGRKTLISLPFKLASGTVDVRSGQIGVDSDGNGVIDRRGMSPEVTSASGDRVVMRAGDRYVSFESADFAARSVVLREHPASDYTLIEVRQGAPLQDFTFTDFDGKERKLSDFKDKHVLIDFWGSWCKPCVEDVPAMKEAYDLYRARGFEIIGLDFEMNNTSDKVRSFLKEKAVDWINATPESVNDLIENRFRVSGFPTLILLAPGNVVVETRSGELRGKKLLATLGRHIDKQ